MLGRGDLIHPQRARIERLDTLASKAAFNPILKGPRPEQDPTYMPAVDVRCQVEQGQDAVQVRSPMGDIPTSQIKLILHYRDLERMGLVDANGGASFRKGDRLVALLTRRGAIERFYSPPLYCTAVEDGGHGRGGRRNLCVLSYENRPQGINP